MKKIFMYVNVDWFFLSHRLPIAERAQEKNIDMHVFTDFTGCNKPSEFSGFKLKKSYISRKSRSIPSLLAEFILTLVQVKREKPDLIHAVTIKPILLLGIISRITRTPFIGAISGLGPAFLANDLKTRFRKFVIISLYKFIFSGRNTHVICQSTHDRDVLVESYIVPKYRTSLIQGSGVDLNKYKPRKSKKPKRPVVFMASRLLSDKGVEEFCQAAKIIKERGDLNIHFQLAGPVDDLSPSSLSLTSVKHMCEETKVEYLGDIECINEYLADATLFAFPSYYLEGVPKVLLEASSCGLPIITTDHPGCRDAIVEDETGILVPIRDAVSLANGIRDLLIDERRLSKMARNARILAERSYGVEKVIAQHYDLYFSKIKRRI